MSTKPSSVPTWDSTLANVSAITGGHATNGFLPNAKPTSGELNTLLNAYGVWIQYLSDGNFAGASSFLSTLAVTGLITASAGLTAAANQHITVSGTGAFKRGTRVRHIPATMGAMVSGNATPDDNYLNAQGQARFTASGNVLSIPIPLDEGERITQVQARVLCGTTDVLTLKVFREDASGTGLIETQLGSTATSAGHASQCETLTVGSLTELAAQQFYSYVAVIQCTAFATAPFAFSIFVTTDIP